MLSDAEMSAGIADLILAQATVTRPAEKLQGIELLWLSALEAACVDGLIAVQEGCAPLTRATLCGLPESILGRIVLHNGVDFRTLVKEFMAVYDQGCDPLQPRPQFADTLNLWMKFRHFSFMADLAALVKPGHSWTTAVYSEISLIGTTMIEDDAKRTRLPLSHDKLRGTTLWCRRSREYFIDSPGPRVAQTKENTK